MGRACAGACPRLGSSRGALRGGGLWGRGIARQWRGHMHAASGGAGVENDKGGQKGGSASFQKSARAVAARRQGAVRSLRRRRPTRLNSTASADDAAAHARGGAVGDCAQHLGRFDGLEALDDLVHARALGWVLVAARLRAASVHSKDQLCARWWRSCGRFAGLARRAARPWGDYFIGRLGSPR